MASVGEPGSSPEDTQADERRPSGQGRPPDGVDFSALSRGERLVLAAGGLLFASGFVPWWFRVQTPSGVFRHTADTGISIAAVALGAAAAAGVVIRAWRFPQRGPADGIAYAVLGVAAAALLAAEIVRDSRAWIGVWVGLGLAAVLTYAGILRRAERRAGWI